LLLLLRSEVVGNIEGFADFLWRLALDHVGNSLATNIKEGLDVEIVGSLGDVELAGMPLLEFQIEHTNMISKSISWSTCINFWSHSSISVVFLRESESSSVGATGSSLWWMHHSITFFRTESVT
jgi:hypothetical protein